MSSLVVQVTTIDEIRAHPNADMLELAIVGGWQCVVPKGQHDAGQKVVYFPPDTVLPENVSDRFGVTKYLSKGRIRCAKLRSEPSFGVVVLPDDAAWPLGTDVAEHYGATKYEPPVRFGAGDAECDHPLFPAYTDIENLRNYPAVLAEGELVSLMEKLHGTNCRVGLIEGAFMAGSHGLRRKEPDDWAANTYWYPLSLAPVRGLLEALGTKHRQVILFGEVYGRGVQNLDYGRNSRDFAAFDLLVDGKYLDPAAFAGLCQDYGVATVPEVTVTEYSLEQVRELAVGSSLIPGANHMREGVVVKPLTERTDPKIGRVILKYVSDAYLLRGKEDYTDR